LSAIIVHIGAGNVYGHYFAVLKNRRRWYKFDDEDITIVEERELQSIFGN
jgi:ubiquitin C-terminal hydrolase